MSISGIYRTAIRPSAVPIYTEYLFQSESQHKHNGVCEPIRNPKLASESQHVHIYQSGSQISAYSHLHSKPKSSRVYRMGEVLVFAKNLQSWLYILSGAKRRMKWQATIACHWWWHFVLTQSPTTNELRS